MGPTRDFSIYIGIDQTGAVNPQGKPRPLTVSLIDNTQETRFFTNLTIPTVSHSEILELVKNYLPHFKDQKVLICVDTVFGLPESTQTPIDQIFYEIKDYQFNGKAFGALTAHAFFNQFRQMEQIPHRKVEQLVGANSVFNLKPFQKNIGCGSYRILKNLAQDRSWFSLWPFEKPHKQFVFAEGYPSYFWKKYLKANSRNITLLQQTFTDLEFKNLDQADSFVLAYGAMLSSKQIENFNISSQTQLEGWILGVPQ